jgi:hypothetical protein
MITSIDEKRDGNMPKMINKWVESGIGLGVVITALFLNRMQVSEVHPQFFPISTAVLMVKDERANIPQQTQLVSEFSVRKIR